MGRIVRGTTAQTAHAPHAPAFLTRSCRWEPGCRRPEEHHVDSTTLGIAVIAVIATAGISWVFVRRRESFRLVAGLTIAAMLLGIVVVLAIPLLRQSAD
jgi:hypothetical protein